MRIIAIFMCFVIFISCNVQKEIKTSNIPSSNTDKILSTEIQSLVDSSNVLGSILIYDLKDKKYYSNNFRWANRGFLPASTFKIVNSIIGLETGVIEDEKFVFKWDGEKKWSKKWEQDLALRDAFQYSCVPCYQDLARNIGVKRMRSYVHKLNYGNLNIHSDNINNFWLEGDSRVTQMQQIDFLKRFYLSQLPISEKTVQIVKYIMLIEENTLYTLSGKTGLTKGDGVFIGWFVGFIEKNDNTYFFATNLQSKNELEFDSFVEKRMKLTLNAFKKLKIID
ncbi:class D beta-lactamase [Flavobacteriaceae bacterium Ap0902]|nr:class D beta-lactamase [Flavobacteriaceae bacterium Ap0902]